MAGEYLPPVITRLTGDISDLAAKVEEAKALIKSLGDGTTIPIKFEVDKASLAAAQAAARAVTNMPGGKIPIGLDLNNLNLAKVAATTAAVNGITAAVTRSRGPIAAWWNTWKNVVHWVVAGSAELLAVGIPALIALGSYAFVALQGFNNMYNHLTSLYTVTEATANIFHKTTGDVLGLGHAMQAAQDQVNTQVYELLGAAVNGARNHLSNFAQMGKEVSGVIDQFAAKVDVELGGAFGAELTGLISNATQDAIGFGQVLGNIGRIILNLAHAMPGLAEVLLGALSGITGLLRDITSQSWSTPLILVAMGLEESWRWGGMLAKVIAGLGTGFVKLAANVTGLASKLAAATGSEALIGASAKATGAVETMGSKMSSVATFLKGPWGWAAIAAAGAIGFLAYKLLSAKSSAELFAESLQNTLGKASNFSAAGIMASNIGQLNEKLDSVSGATARVSTATNVANAAGLKYGATQMQMAQAASTYRSSISQTTTQQAVFAQGAAAIMKQFGVGYPAALAIADGAQVKLATSALRFGKNANIAGQQIENFVAGIKGMSAPTSALGADLNAVAIQTQLADTKVTQMNSALDQFLQTLTQGTSGFADFTTALQNMGKDSAATSASLSGSIGSVKIAAGGLTYTLKGLGSNSMQSWQQFDQALGGTAETLADWFRTAGAEGVATSSQYTKAIKDMVAQLLPFTQGNKTAVSELSAFAQQAGGPVTNSQKVLAKWLGNTKNAAKDLQSQVDSVTGKMSNMSKVAQNLGDVLNSQIDTALASNIMKQSGLNKAIAQYAADLDRLGPKNQKTESALARLNRLYNQAEAAARRASQGTAAFGSAVAAAGGKLSKAELAALRFAGALNAIPRNISISISEYESLTGRNYGPGPGAAPPLGSGVKRATYDSGGWLMPGYTLAHNATGQPERVTSPGGSGPAASGGPSSVHIYLDGQEIHGAVKQQNYIYNGNNGNRARGGGPSGAWTPRG